MAGNSKPQEGERILAFEEPVDLDIMVQETDEEANWLAYLVGRARRSAMTPLRRPSLKGSSP